MPQVEAQKPTVLHADPQRQPVRPDQAAAPKPAASPDLLAKKTESVTYLPREGDPAKVKWAGRVFHANIPLKIDNPEIIQKARGNKWFHVGEGAPHANVEETFEPKTSEQYRAHVVAWLKTVERVGELDARWESEEALRISCGVGTDDLDFLATLVSPRRHELRKMDQAA